MRIPPYWARAVHTGKDTKGKNHSYSAFGWSLESLAAAREDASARAKRIFDFLITGKTLEQNQYEYLDQPLREEIIETISHNSQEIALITRNRYGALVLNAASVCFADIDFPPMPTKGFIDAILLAFSTKRREQRIQAVRDETIKKVKDWAGQNPDRSFRMYRTCAGLRLLFTDRLYDPTSKETDNFLKALGSDPLYRKLTEKQECFRARLTPKPWRCGCDKPPGQYPWIDADAEKICRQWEQKYQNGTKQYATCELMDTIGTGIKDKAIDTVVELHDQYVLNNAGAVIA